MKRMNYTQSITAVGLGIIMLAGLQSCSSPSDDPNVQKNIEAAEDILNQLPELKEEVDRQKEKKNAQELSGTFEGELDGEAFEFANWKAPDSRITFLDFKARVQATISTKPMENLTIEFVAGDWSKKEFPTDIAPSMFVSENGEYLKVGYTKKDANGEVIQEFQAAEGKMTVKQFDSEHAIISFEGEGFVGDVRLQERVPLSFEIDLNYNFVSSDARTIQ